MRAKVLNRPFGFLCSRRPGCRMNSCKEEAGRRQLVDDITWSGKNCQRCNSFHQLTHRRSFVKFQLFFHSFIRLNLFSSLKKMKETNEWTEEFHFKRFRKRVRKGKRFRWAVWTVGRADGTWPGASAPPRRRSGGRVIVSSCPILRQNKKEINRRITTIFRWRFSFFWKIFWTFF